MILAPPSPLNQELGDISVRHFPVRLKMRSARVGYRGLWAIIRNFEFGASYSSREFTSHISSRGAVSISAKRGKVRRIIVA